MSAFATDYCVGSPAGCSGFDEGTNLQQALDDAKANTGPDRVFVGPGNYTRLDGFDYSDIVVANTVEIRGVGSPKPTLTMTTSGSSKNVLNISQSGSLVSDLAFDIPATAVQGRGIALLGGNNTAQRVTVTGSAPSPFSLQTGIQMGASSNVLESTISVDPASSVGIYAFSGSSASVKDSTIVGARAIDLAVPAGFTATLSRNNLSATNDGVYMYYGDVDIDNTLIDLRGGSGEAIHMSTVQATNNSNTIDANELTIRNGDANSAGIRQTAGNMNATQTINLRDSIIWDVGHPLKQDTPSTGATYTFNSFIMDYDASDNLPASPVAGQVRNESTINTVDPGFLNPVFGANGLSGDYRLAFDSLMLDQDPSPGLLYAGETDIRGLDRIVDSAPPFTAARRDLGPYEYQHAAPSAQASASPSPAVTGQAVSFNGSGSSDVDGDALTYAWMFDDGGSASGAAVTHAFSTVGTHSATLTVTDPTGLMNATTATVNVAAPATGPTGPTGQRAAALKKCKKIKNKVKRKKCKKRAKRLPL